MNEQTALVATGQPSLSISQSAYDKVTDPMVFSNWLGDLIKQSGTFGCADGPGGAAQGKLIAMQCLVERIPPMEFARTYHLIEGKQVMKADAMLARFQMRGGKVKWNKMTNSEVSATFIFGDNSLDFSAIYDEFVKSGVAVSGSGKIKDNWRRTPRAMLRSRVVSEAVRTLMPEVIYGFYTPEEVEDFEPKPVKQEAAPANPAKQWTPAQSVIDKLDAKFAAHADAVNQHLINRQIIKDGQSYRDLRGNTANVVLESADEIIANATAPVVEVVEGGAK